jgi:hypothetical protein
VIFDVFIKKKFIFMKNILNEELNRMQYLFGYKKGMVISEQAEVRQGTKGDPYQYKREGVAGGNPPDAVYYYAKKTEGNNPKWIEQKNKGGWEAIRDKIFANQNIKGTPVDSTTTTTVPEIATSTGMKVQNVFDQLATDKNKMNNQTFNTFGYFVKMAPGADPTLPNQGKVDGVASTLKTEDFKTKYPDYSSYRFVPTPEGGFKPDIDVESGAVYGNEPTINDKTADQTAGGDTTGGTTGQENKQGSEVIPAGQEKPTSQLEYENQSQWCKDNVVPDFGEKCFSMNVKPGQTVEKAKDDLSRLARQQGYVYKRDENFDQAEGTLEQVRGQRGLSKEERNTRQQRKPKTNVGDSGQSEYEFNKDTQNMIEIDRKLEGFGPNERDFLKKLLKDNKGSVLGVGEGNKYERAVRRANRDAKDQLGADAKVLGSKDAPYNPDTRKYKHGIVGIA